MKRDAAFTLLGQIKQHREDEDREMVSYAEEILRDLQSTFEVGEKAAKLDWKALAQAGGVSKLYSIHRMLSGVSSHVTGMSVLPDIEFVDEPDLAANYRKQTRIAHPFWMMAATLHGTLLHEGIIDQTDLAAEAVELAKRLDFLTSSKGW